MTRLTDRINILNNRAAEIGSRIHSSLRKPLKVYRLYQDEFNVYQEDITVITPPPKVTNIRPRDIGIDFGTSESQGAIRLSALDYLAIIPRINPKSLFLKADDSRVTVVVEDVGTPEGEFECSVLYVDDSECCDYKVYLRRLHDGRRN